MNYLARRRHTYWLAALPALAVLLLQLCPLGYAVRSALTDSEGHLSAANILRVYSDTLFLRSVGYNTLIPVVSVALEALIGVGMALWFYYLRRGRTFWRTIAIVPFAVPEIVYLFTMKLVFRQHGYLNSLLCNVGGDQWPVGWLQPGSILSALVVILVDAWRVTPIVFVILLSALEQLPESYVEAAQVDGATKWQVTYLVQIPMVVPALLVALAVRSIDAFRIFATPLVLMGVEPLPVLTSVAYHYKIDANDAAAANVVALTLAFGLLIAVATAFAFVSRRERTA